LTLKPNWPFEAAMNGDRDHERKEPLPLAVSRSARELPPGDQVEPRLRAFGGEPSVSEESGLVVPSDLRAAHQSRGSAPIIAIAAFIVFCLCGAGYAAWTFGGADNKPATPETAATLPAQAAAPIASQPTSRADAPAAASTSAAPSAPPVATAPPAPPNPPTPVVDQAAEQVRQQAAAETRRVEQAKRDKARREQVQREQAQREQALREREQAENARLAAIRRHEDKVRVERQRKEAAARRAQQARAQQEQAVQEQLDQAAVTPAQPPQPPSAPPPRRIQNAKLTPTSPSGDAPPLDATDLPPRAPGTVNDSENQ
jgi:hypothetical protein